MAPVLTIAMLAALSNNAVRLVIMYRALDLGAGPVEIGIIASAFAVLSMLAALPIGRWVDRFGAGVFIAGGMTISAITCLALIWVDSLVVLGMAYALLGLGQTINLVAAQTAVGNRGGRRGRDERYGSYATVVSVGQLAGPALAGALAAGVFGDLGLGGLPARSLAPVFMVGFVIDVVAAFISLALIREAVRGRASGVEPGPEPPRMWTAARRVLARPGMLRAMLVSVVVISSNDVVATYLPLYGELTGLSIGFVGLLLSVRAGAGLVSRAALGVMLRRLGRRRLLTAGMAMSGVALLGLPLASSELMLIAVMVFVGLGLGLVQPITIAWVAGLTPRAERATALGIRITGNRAALLSVPAAMGVLAGATSVAVIFGVMAVFILVGAGAALSAKIADSDAPPEAAPIEPDATA